MKKLLSTLALVVLALYGLPAKADVTLPGDFDGKSFAFGDTFAAGIAGASWTSTVNFTLAAANTVKWLFATDDLGIHDLDVQSVTFDGGAFLPTSDSFAAGAGVHALTVAGIINGIGDSSYVGLVQALAPVDSGGGEPPPVGAIPEPGTYAMMFAGLAAMGFVARRRRQT